MTSTTEKQPSITESLPAYTRWNNGTKEEIVVEHEKKGNVIYTPLKVRPAGRAVSKRWERDLPHEEIPDDAAQFRAIYEVVSPADHHDIAYISVPSLQQRQTTTRIS